MNSASRWGRIANHKKPWKIIGDFPSDFTCNSEMKITVLFWSFLFLKINFSNSWKDFPAWEWYFSSTFKKKGGWIDLLALRVSTFENQPPLDAPTKAQKKNRVFAQEVSQFEKEPPLDAPTKAQFRHCVFAQDVSQFGKELPLDAPAKAKFSNNAWDQWWEQHLKKQHGTWMIIFLKGSSVFQ